ncbi:mechanosensitive ion channel protein MscS [Pontibacter toksunensis]|uniref:Mechanosensitive ion channel protein MscS n=1 Tax=Pontibacter toksunensis TaxID=1332631 RepID=A0ABW6BVF9_9BACT
MIRNLIYAILLGVGMAACLSQNENESAEESNVQQQINATETEVTAPDPTSLVIEKGQVGNLKIGMPINQVREQVPSGMVINDTTLMLEGQQSTAYVLRSKGQEKGLLIEQVCEPNCLVWRISVDSQEYKTAEGLGVGSKYGEIKQAYPIGTVALVEDNFVAVSEEAGMSFVLDDTQLPQDARDLGRYNPGNIPANTLVKRVLLY